jgi:hypothetical protein
MKPISIAHPPVAGEQGETERTTGFARGNLFKIAKKPPKQGISSSNTYYKLQFTSYHPLRYNKNQPFFQTTNDKF